MRIAGDCAAGHFRLMAQSFGTILSRIPPPAALF
jgi:hypothetical protein